MKRVIAQVMDLGTYADIRRLEDVLGPDLLIETMIGAQPGWFSARSWEFWRGRLAAHPRASIVPEQPPSRMFGRASSF